MTLNYIIPYILQGKFDDLDRFYRNYMHLIVIVVLCCSPYCTSDTAGELQLLVEAYLHGFKQIYPIKPLRPKHHFLLHLPMQILRFGPLRNQWLFQFKSKNNSFKNFKIHNFINLPYSLTKYHQLASCYSLMGSDGTRSENYLYSGDIAKEGNTVKFTDLYPDLAGEYAIKICPNNDYMVYDTNEIIMHGLKYRPGACLLIAWEYTTPVFAQIDKLFVYQYTKFAVCSSLETGAFEWTNNSFNVHKSDIRNIFVLKDLQNKWPLPMYKKFGESFICNHFSHFGQRLF